MLSVNKDVDDEKRVGAAHDNRRFWRLLNVRSPRIITKFVDGRAASLDSLSESVRVFDPELLQPVLQELLDKSEPALWENYWNRVICS